MNYKVTHYPTRQRFEIELENMTAYAEYRLTDNSLDIIHTFVPPALEGRGSLARSRKPLMITRKPITSNRKALARTRRVVETTSGIFTIETLFKATGRHTLRCSARDSGVIPPFIDTNTGTSYHSRSKTYRQLIGNLSVTY